MAYLTPEALDHFECHHGIASSTQLSEFGVTRDARKRSSGSVPSTWCSKVPTAWAACR